MDTKKIRLAEKQPQHGTIQDSHRRGAHAQVSMPVRRDPLIVMELAMTASILP